MRAQVMKIAVDLVRQHAHPVAASHLGELRQERVGKRRARGVVGVGEDQQARAPGLGRAGLVEGLGLEQIPILGAGVEPTEAATEAPRLRRVGDPGG